jgi:hypothetical protein
MEVNQNALNDVPLVKISPEGIFKYILIQAKVHENNQEKLITFVRGDAQQEYHADNFSQFIAEVKSKGFEIKGKNEDQGKF